MNITDLEMYRWRWHNDIFLQQKNIKRLKENYLHCEQYWKEIGAFTSVLPRQSGKTTMIGKMIDFVATQSNKRNYVVFVSQLATVWHFCKTTGLPTDGVKVSLSEFATEMTAPENYHLFVDEFLYAAELHELLRYYWASVTLVGSLK